MMFEDILLSLMKFVPDNFKRKEMFNEAVCNNLWALRHVPNHFKTQEMCQKEAMLSPWSLKCIPNWFMTELQIKLLYDDKDYRNNDKLNEWCEGYQNRKAQKASIKEKLLPIAWHPSRYWDWCMSEEEKTETEKLWV